MTREQIKLLLIENGVEKPTEGMITGILNSYNSGVKAAVKEATDAVEAKYKDYVSPDDHKKVTDENATLKDAQVKATRLNKLAEAGIAKKWLDHADGVIGSDEKDYDKRMKEFIKNNPELMAKKTDVKTTVLEGQGGGSAGPKEDNDDKSSAEFNKDFRAAFGLNNDED